MKVKVCWNCKEYVPIHEGSYESQKIEKEFIATHNGHTLLTMDMDEAKEGNYRISKMASP